MYTEEQVAEMLKNGQKFSSTYYPDKELYWWYEKSENELGYYIYFSDKSGGSLWTLDEILQLLNDGIEFPVTIN